MPIDDFPVSNAMTTARRVPLTIAHKATLTSGADFWRTSSVPGVRSIRCADGPHGLRKQIAEGGAAETGESVPATCFPTASALASTGDLDLVARVGSALGREAAAEGIAVLLGPGVDIKRSPLCGRNFEYLSEDPHLAGRLGPRMYKACSPRGSARR